MAATIPSAGCGHFDTSSWICSICHTSACLSCTEGRFGDEDNNNDEEWHEPWWRCNYCGKRLCDECEFDGETYEMCEVNGCGTVSCRACDRVRFLDIEMISACDEHLAGFCKQCHTHILEFSYGNCAQCAEPICPYCCCNDDGDIVLDYCTSCEKTWCEKCTNELHPVPASCTTPSALCTSCVREKIGSSQCAGCERHFSACDAENESFQIMDHCFICKKDWCSSCSYQKLVTSCKQCHRLACNDCTPHSNLCMRCKNSVCVDDDDDMSSA
jgi:hypothetical protein